MASDWWRGAVIYQVYPRSFLDTNGDGVGDLPGITARLDHIASLGVDALWISPFFRSPMKDFGYDVSDYRAVDPLFGRDEDADTLIAEAHARGLRVVIDMVMGHSSDQHPWFRESRTSRTNPKADWYVWADPRPDGTPPNNWLSIFGGSTWQWDAVRAQYYLHFFLREQPNLNWHNPALADAMMAEADFWFDRGVDGLRLDAITTLVPDRQLRDNPPAAEGVPSDIAGTSANPFVYQEHRFDRDQPGLLDIMARLRGLADRRPDGFLLGEVGDIDTIAATAKYTAGTGRLHSCYTFQLTHPEFGAARIRDVVARKEAMIGDGWFTYAFGNHDTMRAVSRWSVLPHLSGDRPALARLLTACLLSLRGSVCLYQGDELGLTEADVPFDRLVDPFGIEFYPTFKGRDGCRTPMPWQGAAPHGGFSTAEPWLPLPAEHLDLAVDRQDADPGSVLNACRRFLRWRKAQPALVTGAITLLDEPEPVFAFERSRGADRLLCAFNLSNRPASMPLAGSWRPLDGHGFTARVADGQVDFPPFGAFFAAAA